MGRLLEALGLAPVRESGGAGARAGIGPGDMAARRARPVRVADVDAGVPDHGFADASAPVRARLETLRRHPQQARVQAEINEVAGLIGRGREAALKGDTAAATELLRQAGVKLAAAQNLANYFIEYAKARTTLDAMSQSLKGLGDPALQDAVDKELQRVDKIAHGTPPRPITGIEELNKSIAKLRPVLQPRVDEVKAMRAALQGKSASLRRFAAAQWREVDAVIAQMDKAAADNAWGLALTAVERAMSLLPPLTHMVVRRESFDTQRRGTAETLARVRAASGMDGRAAALEALLRRADTLATPDEMGFDEATRLLEQAGTRGATWLSISAWVGSYDQLRAAGLRDAAALAKDPAARTLAAQRAAVDKLLADAAATVAAAEAGGDLVAGFRTAQAGVARANAELARLKEQAQTLGPVLQARARAKDASDVDGLTKGLAALRAEADLAAKAPFAADAAGELRRFAIAAGDCAAALGKGNGKVALARLDEATQALSAARRVQLAHGQFDAALAKAAARRKALDALPTAAALKAKLALVDAALAEARAKIKVPDAAAALAALQRADDAALAAETADTGRRRFDAEAAGVDGLVKGVADARLRADLAAQAKAALALADRFRFDDAGRALAAIRVRIDEAAVRSLSASKPGDPALAAAAERMMKNGGAKALEKLIADFPEKGSPQAMAAIAKARHGLEFTLDAAAPQAGEIKALKVISKELALLPPQDTQVGPSLRTVVHGTADSERDQYRARSATINLASAAGGADKQRFGADLKVPGSNKPQLPPVERDCQPVNDDPVDRLNWATLHEVGHALDDRHRFMARHEQDATYGNWKTYGTAVQPIADAVAASYGFDSTAEQRRYVLDLILNTPTAPPPEPATAPGGGLRWEDLRQGVEQWRALAGRQDVYKDQGACNALTIVDTIYHEAYPRLWVSYPASERRKGLTGYQFRAPGEWFAELYAGYRSGKLGKRHPALAWLKKIAP